jgi:putative glutamine amidotransferase
VAGRPRIGVTGPRGRAAPGRLFAAGAILAAGGRPLLLYPGDGSVPEFDALVVTGGSDIEATLYGGPADGPARPDPLRDGFELDALRLADQRQASILGICRGAQLLNVHRGGTLHGDVAGLRRKTSNRPSLLPRKRVTIEPTSRVARICGRRQLRVNSLHHQAVKGLGRNLEIVGRDRDDIVQAIEDPAPERLCIGVQWHPEYLAVVPSQFRLFRALVDAATASQKSGRCAGSESVEQSIGRGS